MAIDELAYQGLTDAQSRRKFLKKMGIVGGGIMAMGVIGEGLSLGVAAAQSANSDIQTVQFAYTLELVAVDAYQTAAKSGLLTPEVVAVGTKFAGHHQDHANALKAALEANKAMVPAKPAKINYPAFKNQADILNFALALEAAAVGAYYTAAGGFTNRDLAAAAASIVGVESTHVAVLNSALMKDPLPTAFVTGTPFNQVQATANSLLGAPAPAAGQGGGTTMPTGAPATGVGMATKVSDDLTGPAVGALGILAAAAGAVLAISRKRSRTEAVSAESDAE